MKYLLLFLLYISSQSVNALNIALVNPTAKEETFWALITELTQEAAKDLNIELTVYYSDSHRMIQSQLIERIVTGKNKPDYLIFLPYGGSILNSFNALESAKVPFVTLERAYDIKRVRQKINKPQETYKYWLGEIYNDNIQDGKLLANHLYRHAKRLIHTQEPLTTIALNGDYYTESLDRAEGFMDAFFDKTDVVINQVVPARWNREEAGRRFLKLNERYGKSDIVWSASDQMALGVLDVLEQTSLVPNKDFVIGGFDLIPEAIRAIHENKLTASVGGHFLQGVWAIIRLYDYHHGIKHAFIKSDDAPFIESIVIDVENIKQYKMLADINDFSSIDFTAFSLHKNQQNDVKYYDLTLKNFIEKLTKASVTH